MATGPRVGPCKPWVGLEDVKNLALVQSAVANPPKGIVWSDGEIDTICQDAASAASEVLYEISGQKYTGHCGPVTVRPLARPVDIDSRTWAGISPFGSFSSWGMCTAYGGVQPGVISHYGCSTPPEIELGAYPVTEIVLVKIDGVTIPPTEYELRDYRTLVRMRPTPSYSPTERYGWPTCQINDLPDTEEGTFSVTYMYGSPPPVAGRIAAKALSQFFALPLLGDTKSFPQRVTSISRQGINVAITDVVDVLRSGSLGIYEVDVFVLAENPNKQARQAAVWSPDLGRPRRTQNPST